MATDAKSIAALINQKHLGQQAMRFEIWGTSPVRPGDKLYELREASAKGDVLTLRFEDKDAAQAGTMLDVVVGSPAGFKATKAGLQIKEASQVSFRGGLLRREGDELVGSEPKNKPRRYPLNGNPPAFECA